MPTGVQIPLPAPFCRLSSVVEHFHGKEGVSGSNPEDGSRLSKSCFSGITSYSVYRSYWCRPYKGRHFLFTQAGIHSWI